MFDIQIENMHFIPFLSGFLARPSDSAGFPEPTLWRKHSNDNRCSCEIYLNPNVIMTTETATMCINSQKDF